MKNFEEKQLSTQEFYRNSFLSIREDNVLLPDGNQSKRIVVDHVGAVNVIALNENNELLLVRQYRYPLGMVMLETPAGKLEKGEASIITAKRELEEETGYTCQSLKSLGNHVTAPGFTGERLESFLASGVTKLEKAVAGDADEFTEVVTVSKADAVRMMEAGDICDMKTVFAIQYLLLNGWN